MASRDLIDFINFQAVELLNARDPTSAANNALKQGYREDAGLVMESDADEQLLINLEFNTKVKLMGIVLKGPADSGPRTVKLFANRSHMGFSDCQGSVPPAQELQLTAAQVSAGETIPLKLVKFAFVQSISIFIEDNQEGTETTKVSKIAFVGQSGDTFDVSQIKKVEDH
ncbi:PITH domain-containing protein [Haematococcus lacustris]|uniref:PITH domain-containing protein n=1 Tax=Haematococcus lacustris TaxID=44745 RepID=A0A6A0A8U4_HAELA|nr:PITH domain-containing protein [Haematococcus lacustris]